MRFTKVGRPLLLCIVLILLASVLVVAYVTSEHFFYSWDYGGYVGVAIQHSIDFRHMPLDTLKAIYHTINDEYNHFFVLPLIPFIWLFGYSRLGFMMGVALL
jgi:hypothetical protein